ncbi:MAG: hypothetical protein ACOYEA_01460 [Fermentimonas sp.]
MSTGASFASTNNGWFEFGCDIIGAVFSDTMRKMFPIN